MLRAIFTMCTVAVLTATVILAANAETTPRDYGNGAGYALMQILRS